MQPCPTGEVAGSKRKAKSLPVVRHAGLLWPSTRRWLFRLQCARSQTLVFFYSKRSIRKNRHPISNHFFDFKPCWGVFLDWH